VCLEELGLDLATTAGTLTIPPECAIAVEDGSARLGDSDIGPRDGNERS
jgi:hypothetical protein